MNINGTHFLRRNPHGTQGEPTNGVIFAEALLLPIDRSTDPPIYYSTDIANYRSIDLQIHRSTDLTIYRFTYLARDRSTDPLIY